MTTVEPCISEYAATVAFVGAVLAALGACALGYAWRLLRGAVVRFRNEKIGADLLDACAGDYESAETAVASVRAENEEMREAIGFGKRVRPFVEKPHVIDKPEIRLTRMGREILRSRGDGPNYELRMPDDSQ